MTENDNSPEEVGKLDEDKLDELAFRIANEEVFITNQKESLDKAFGFILGMLAHDNFDTKEEWEEYSKTIGAVYEEYDKASTRAINGIPMFFSASLLHKDQVDDLQDKINDYNKQLDNIDPTQTVNDTM